MKTPNTITFSGELLEKMKKEGSVPQAVLDFVRNMADGYLCSNTVHSVIYRKTKPPTKNPHEYASMGPYWWPNPDTEDGLPYIRRDGYVNPESVEEISYARMTQEVFCLSLAAYYFEERKYAERAEKVLCDWFLNPETYMEPHLEYGQFIPGVCSGRGIGIVDFVTSHNVFNGVRILESMDYISEQTVKGIEKWFRDFTDWLLTSETGLDEDLQLNNHGTLYDADILGLAIFTGRKFLAEKICKTAYKRRFKDQVEPDGKQPLELARTRAIGYSIANLQGLILIANMAKKCGYTQYWEKDEERGECIIKSAVDYIYPFVKNPETFPYEEIQYQDVPRNMAPVLLSLAYRFDSEEYKKAAEEFISEPYLWLAYPRI